MLHIARDGDIKNMNGDGDGEGVLPEDLTEWNPRIGR